jgi:hypothetical protein
LPPENQGTQTPGTDKPLQQDVTTDEPFPQPPPPAPNAPKVLFEDSVRLEKRDGGTLEIVSLPEAPRTGQREREQSDWQQTGGDVPGWGVPSGTGTPAQPTWKPPQKGHGTGKMPALQDKPAGGGRRLLIAAVVLIGLAVPVGLLAKHIFGPPPETEQPPKPNPTLQDEVDSLIAAHKYREAFAKLDESEKGNGHLTVEEIKNLRGKVALVCVEHLKTKVREWQKADQDLLDKSKPFAPKEKVDELEKLIAQIGDPKLDGLHKVGNDLVNEEDKADAQALKKFLDEAKGKPGLATQYGQLVKLWLRRDWVPKAGQKDFKEALEYAEAAGDPTQGDAVILVCVAECLLEERKDYAKAWDMVKKALPTGATLGYVQYVRARVLEKVEMNPIEAANGLLVALRGETLPVWQSDYRKGEATRILVAAAAAKTNKGMDQRYFTDPGEVYKWLKQAVLLDMNRSLDLQAQLAVAAGQAKEVGASQVLEIIRKDQGFLELPARLAYAVCLEDARQRASDTEDGRKAVLECYRYLLKRMKNDPDLNNPFTEGEQKALLEPFTGAIEKADVEELKRFLGGNQESSTSPGGKDLADEVLVKLTGQLVKKSYANLSVAKEFQDLKVYLEKAIASPKASDLTQACFAECLLRQNEGKLQSSKEVEEALGVTEMSNEPYVLFVRGLSRQAKSDWKNAVNAYRKAFREFDPKRLAAWQNEGRGKLAAKAYYRASKDAWENEREKVQPDQVLHDFQTAEQLDPLIPDDCLPAYAEVAFKMEKIDTFVAKLDLLLDKDWFKTAPDKVKASIGRHYVFWAEENDQKDVRVEKMLTRAERALRAAVNEGPSDAVLDYWMAKLCWGLWKKNKDTEQRKEALRRFGTSLALSEKTLFKPDKRLEKVKALITEQKSSYRERKDSILSNWGEVYKAALPEKEREKWTDRQWELVVFRSQLLFSELMANYSQLQNAKLALKDKESLEKDKESLKEDLQKELPQLFRDAEDLIKRNKGSVCFQCEGRGIAINAIDWGFYHKSFAKRDEKAKDEEMQTHYKALGELLKEMKTFQEWSGATVWAEKVAKNVEKVDPETAKIILKNLEEFIKLPKPGSGKKDLDRFHGPGERIYLASSRRF